MNTKKILTWTAIGLGAYLAYRYFTKPKTANAGFVGNEDAYQAPFVGNEDAYQAPFVGNEDAFRKQPSGFASFAGTIAVNKSGANPTSVKKAVHANLGRKRAFN
jgi:hypothetical protein